MTQAHATQLLYGLRVASELPLYQERPAPDGAAPDVEIRIGETMRSTEQRPEGQLLVDLDTDRLLYSATARDDGSYVVRFYRTCDFVVQPDLSRVTLHLVDDADPHLAGVLATGTLLSFLLALRGNPVLHASAVQVGDSALAFVGASGMGKSTMATLMCADGARLITDDVLRLDLAGIDGAPTCYLGATEVRLRKAAGDLAARFSDRPERRLTSDARDALRTPTSTQQHLPLKAIVIPLPDHEGGQEATTVTRLESMEALLTLLRFPRILGWEDPAIIDRQFQQLGHVVERVPVYVANLAWGPPFPADIAVRVTDAVGLATRPAVP